MQNKVPKERRDGWALSSGTRGLSRRQFSAQPPRCKAEAGEVVTSTSISVSTSICHFLSFFTLSRKATCFPDQS